ncbi:MAG: glycosyltransferase family 4 protein [bacterium]
MSSRHLKVLRIITRLNVGGPSIQAITLSADLPKDDFTTTLVCGRTGPREGDMRARAEENGLLPVVVPTLHRELDPLNDVRSLVKIIGIMRKERPDILHTHLAKAGAIGRVAALFCPGVKKVHTYHGHVFSGYFSPTRTRFYLNLERWLARRTDRIVVLSRSQRSEILERYGIGRSEQYEVIPLGFDLEGFGRAHKLRGELRKELDIPPDSPVVSTVGRLVPIKDHELFLEAAHRVLDGCSNTVFLVVGDGPMRERLEGIVRTRELGKSVIFLGWRSDLERVYADSDLVVLSSRNEGTPVSLIEAAATGRAIVATDVGGVSDVVRHGVSGLLSRSREPGDIADLILELLRDRPRAVAMGEEGKRFVRVRYSKKQINSNEHKP